MDEKYALDQSLRVCHMSYLVQHSCKHCPAASYAFLSQAQGQSMWLYSFLMALVRIVQRVLTFVYSL
jgi:hypothetical protein